MRLDHSVANATRVLDYRKKGESIARSTAPGETATLVATTVLAVLSGGVSLLFLDLFIGDKLDWEWLPLFVISLAVTLTIAISGASALRRLRDGWQMDTLVCGGCGYDIRASHERCPECGRSILNEDVARRLRKMVGPPVDIAPSPEITEDAR
jgi:predicted RNA-binding Zn-ribbon protein involved in translation (DUF1610 family)